MGTRGGRDEGVDRWAVKGIFRVVVRSVSLSKLEKSGGMNFLRCTTQCTCLFRIFITGRSITGHSEPNIVGNITGLLPISEWRVRVMKDRDYTVHMASSGRS